MEVEFLSKFLKDLDHINQPHVGKAELKVSAEAERSKSLAGIRHCKKLSS